MLALKDRWRVSVAMMIGRCEDLGITGPDETRRLWINYTRRGWRAQEPLDAVLKAEQPRLLRHSLEMLVSEGIRTKEQILSDLPLPAREIEELTALPSGYLSGRHAEVKALPTLRSRPQPQSDEDGCGPDGRRSGEIVSLFGGRRGS